MAIYTIGDLHLSLGADKAMDIFPGWENYVARIEENWKNTVREEDTVVLAGDISWGFSVHRRAAGEEAAAQGQPRLLVDHQGKDGGLF